jgi:uncharacterized repeat protein (TIGR04138 family)
MTMHYAGLAEVVRRDPRYVYEAYEFVFEALRYTQAMLDRLPPEERGAELGAHHHVSGKELLEGIRRYAQRQFGLMARTVFRLWGINRTDDFGEIVFNLVEAKLMTQTDSDQRGDFHAVFDLDKALVEDYQIQLDETD